MSTSPNFDAATDNVIASKRAVRDFVLDKITNLIERQELLDSLANVSGSAVTENYVQSAAADSAAAVEVTVLQALQDSSNAIRGDLPVDTDTQLSQAQVNAFESDPVASQSVIDSSAAIRADFPVLPVDIVQRQELLDSLANVSGSAVTESYVQTAAGDSATVAELAALQALQDSSAAIRADFPVDTDTQLSQAQVNALRLTQSLHSRS